jgi:hypothetical protein
MAFAVVSDVRLRAGLEAAVAPEEMVEEALDDAHAIVAASLRAEVAEGPAPDAVVAAEALMAAAMVLRALSARAAAELRTVKVGGQSVERGRQAAELMAVAARFEADAWEMLAPWRAALPAHHVEATDSVYIL